jgi:hypothetical protein
MAIRPVTPEKEVFARVDRDVKILKTKAEYLMNVVGTQAQNDAVLNGSYKDRTHRLRGSCGYVTVSDGQVRNVGEFGNGQNSPEGMIEGEAFARRLASEFTNGMALIVVAGMDYAKHVSAKGYNVLDSSELLARQLMAQRLKQLGFK